MTLAEARANTRKMYSGVKHYVRDLIAADDKAKIAAAEERWLRAHHKTRTRKKYTIMAADCSGDKWTTDNYELAIKICDRYEEFDIEAEIHVL
jgi:hypothetical protein